MRKRRNDKGGEGRKERREKKRKKTKNEPRHKREGEPQSRDVTRENSEQHTLI